MQAAYRESTASDGKGAGLGVGERRPLIVLLLISMVLYGYQLWWGLPNGNDTWAVDAIPPLTPLSIAQKSFLSGWNSGWFYFKYPIGHPLLLLLAYAPYLVLRLVTGRTRSVGRMLRDVARSPHAAGVLALIGRVVTVTMATATVWLLYRIARRLFGERAALWSAAGTSAGLGLVFYAHTTNLDVPYLFWTAVAWDAALALTAGAGRRAVLGFGAAAGMALATKEQAFAFLLGLGVVVAGSVLVQVWRGARRAAVAVRDLAGGVGLGLFVLFVASNGFYNPSGFLRRVEFLTGTLPRAVQAELAPRAAYIAVGAVPGLQGQWAMFRGACSAMTWSMGCAWLVLSLAGLALALRRAPLMALSVGLPAVGYYLLSLPAMPPPPNVRYVLPMTIALSLFGGVAAAALWGRGRLGRAAVLAALAYTFAAGAGVDYLLARDPRYAAEGWLREHTRPGMRVEVYQKATFLPRFPARLVVEEPEFHAITRAAFAQRAPDLLVLNMAELKHIVARYDKLDPVLVRPPENTAFLHALLHGELGYHAVASFHARWPLIPDGTIRSLAPRLLLLARDGAWGKPPTP